MLFNYTGLKYNYFVVEVLDPKNGRGAEIWRSIGYDTLEEANDKLETLKPKENGILKVKKEIVRPF